MTKIKQLLLKVPVVLLGVAFLLFGFAEIADLSAFHNEFLNIQFLPYFLAGLAILFIPGLQLTLGLIFICDLNSLKKPAATIAFLFFLTTLTFGVYVTLTGDKSCGGCGQLEKTLFNWKAWQPVGVSLAALVLSVVVLFMANSDPDSRRQH